MMSENRSPFRLEQALAWLECDLGCDEARFYLRGDPAKCSILPLIVVRSPSVVYLSGRAPSDQEVYSVASANAPYGVNAFTLGIDTDFPGNDQVPAAVQYFDVPDAAFDAVKVLRDVRSKRN